MSYPQYSRYKDSGVEWLGEIPAHWDIRRLKLVANVQLSNVDKHTVEEEDRVFLCNYVDVYKNEKITRTIEFMRASASDEQINRLTLTSGDVLITKDSETPDDIAVSAFVPEDLPSVVCGYHLALIRPLPRFLFGAFLHRVFQSSFAKANYSASATGVTRFGLGKDSIANACISIPSFEEQQAIAGFLDRRTAKIDEVIWLKEQHIALLNKKRQALINRAVMRGLDPSAKLRPSGIEWLGDIPEHWETTRTKYVSVSLQTGPFGSQLHAEDYIEDGVPVINPANIESGKIIPDARNSVDQDTFRRLSHHAMEEGDIVIGRRGEMGRCGLVTSKEAGWLCGTGCLRIRLNTQKAYPPFMNLLLALTNVKSWLSLESVGSTMDNLNTEILSRIPLALPPLDEQGAIVKYIDRETARIDEIVQTIKIQIDKLRDYRQALISAAVAGKIDVRGLAV